MELITHNLAPIMFAGLVIFLLLGFPVAFSLGACGLFCLVFSVRQRLFIAFTLANIPGDNGDTQRFVPTVIVHQKQRLQRVDNAAIVTVAQRYFYLDRPLLQARQQLLGSPLVPVWR